MIKRVGSTKADALEKQGRLGSLEAKDAPLEWFYLEMNLTTSDLGLKIGGFKSHELIF
jgi:hypothetical protein